MKKRISAALAIAATLTGPLLAPPHAGELRARRFSPPWTPLLYFSDKPALGDPQAERNVPFRTLLGRERPFSRFVTLHPYRDFTPRRSPLAADILLDTEAKGEELCQICEQSFNPEALPPELRAVLFNPQAPWDKLRLQVHAQFYQLPNGQGEGESTHHLYPHHAISPRQMNFVLFTGEYCAMRLFGATFEDNRHDSSAQRPDARHTLSREQLPEGFLSKQVNADTHIPFPHFLRPLADRCRVVGTDDPNVSRSFFSFVMGYCLSKGNGITAVLTLHILLASPDGVLPERIPAGSSLRDTARILYEEGETRAEGRQQPSNPWETLWALVRGEDEPLPEPRPEEPPSAPAPPEMWDDAPPRLSPLEPLREPLVPTEWQFRPPLPTVELSHLSSALPQEPEDRSRLSRRRQPSPAVNSLRNSGFNENLPPGQFSEPALRLGDALIPITPDLRMQVFLIRDLFPAPTEPGEFNPRFDLRFRRPYRHPQAVQTDLTSLISFLDQEILLLGGPRYQPNLRQSDREELRPNFLRKMDDRLRRALQESLLERGGDGLSQRDLRHTTLEGLVRLICFFNGLQLRLLLESPSEEEIDQPDDVEGGTGPELVADDPEEDILRLAGFDTP
ncbi:MAG: hypothetical protein LBF21_01555 [Puniceicoccales bacterium]|jgi:hypothetical protein|nr:hypothetical protein [Puniceicoccales bacterium]